MLPSHEQDSLRAVLSDLGIEFLNRVEEHRIVSDGSLTLLLQDDILPSAFLNFPERAAVVPMIVQSISPEGDAQCFGRRRQSFQLLIDAAVEKGIAVANEEDMRGWLAAASCKQKHDQAGKDDMLDQVL